MRSTAIILAVTVTAGSVRVDFEGSRYVLKTGQSQAFGADKEATPVLPAALKGFSGMVQGKVVNVSKDSIVLKLASAFKNRATVKFSEADLKDKEVVVMVKDVKELPQLQADDQIFAVVTQVEDHLVATRVDKYVPAGGK